MPTSANRQTSRKTIQLAKRENRQRQQQEKDKNKNKEIAKYSFEQRLISGQQYYLFDFDQHIAECQKIRKIINAATAGHEFFAKEYMKRNDANKSNIDLIDMKQYLAELVLEQRVLKGLDTLIMPQRVYMPPDMLWEIWGFIPTSVKQIFVDMRHNRLIALYIKSINRLTKYSSGLLHKMLYEIPLDKLMKFMRLGSPAKYYIQPAYSKIATLYDLVISKPTDKARQFAIIYNIINMVLDAYDNEQFDRMTAVINAVLRVHGRFGTGEKVCLSMDNIDEGKTINAFGKSY